jgi:hypothetical protein
MAKLVAIGDSLTQGFQSLAISRTDLSFPAMIAERMGLLDGVHPTTCGYALIAQEFISVMRGFNPTVRDIDYAEVRRWDTLVSSPPLTLYDVFGMLQTLEKRFHMSRWLRNIGDVKR